MANLCERQGRKATYLRTKDVYDRRVAEMVIVSRIDFINIFAPKNRQGGRKQNVD